MPTFCIRFVIRQSLYIHHEVYLYRAINSRSECHSKYNECVASRGASFFFFNPLYGDVGMAAADRHVDCLCRRAINGVVVTLFE